MFSDLSGECSMYNQECAFFCFGWKVLYMPVGSTLSVVLFKCAVYWFFCVFYLLFKIGYWNLLLLFHCCQFLLSDFSILVLHTKVLWFWVYVCLQLLYLSVEFTLLSFCHDLFFGGRSLEAVFNVKSASSDLNITTPFFSLSFVGNIFFFLSLSAYGYLQSKVSFL